MSFDYASGYTAVLVAGAVGVAFVVLVFLASRILAPHQSSATKASIYECGMVPVGRDWSQIHIRYYIYAILFVIFDVEVVFLFPWAMVFERVGPAAFYEMVLFIGVLLLGLAYAWRKGVLQWR